MRTLIVFILLSSLTDAHDLWLIPAETAAAHQSTTVIVSQGMAFPESTGAPNVGAFAEAFVIDSDRAKTKLSPLAAEGKSGRLGFTPTRDGLHVLAVTTTPKRLTMAAAAFNAYLVSDGLPHIYLMRHAEKALDTPGDEQYRKCVKAIARVGRGDDGDVTRPLGLMLEIVPKSNPLTRRIGETLSVQVLFNGLPLGDANLGWARPGDGETPRGTVRTDSKGNAMIPIAAEGLMTVRLTHMTRPKAADTQWESFWTTLTFRIDPAK